MINEAPVVHEDSAGLLVIDWPRFRPAHFEVSAELFEALVSIVNVERRRAHEMAVTGLRVCDRWDADEVDDGAMDREIGQLRQAIGGGT